MSEAGDYEPAAHWHGHDFNSARKAYHAVVDRSYDDAKKKKLSVEDLVPKSLVTESEAPLVIAVDVTGSMGEWPATIFSKLPYLEFEGKEYLGDHMEISFCAVGDSHSDDFPLQVREFAQGADLKKELEALVHEGGGGGSSEESYDLAALYYARSVSMPGAIRKPLFIFVGDEGVYSVISSDADEWCRMDVEKRLTPNKVFKELQEKFSVYIVRKPYGCDGNESSPANDRIQRQWEKFLGEERVISLPEPGRVVDVIFGILANETGRVEYFEDELRERQGPDKDGDKKIKVVLKSLHSVHSRRKKSPKKIGRAGDGDRKALPFKKKAGEGEKSVSLLDDDGE